MELSFVSQNVRVLCENEENAKEILGAPLALTLKSRLADMRAAMFVSELIAGLPGKVNYEGIPAYKVDLTIQERIIFCCAHNNIPKLTDGSIDWHQVSRIKLITIANQTC